MKWIKNQDELCHAWAHKLEPAGKTKTMFFEDNVIYSYGYHFPIARHLDNGDILFTTQDYSVTTSQHKSKVLQSIDIAPGCHVWHVPYTQHPYEPANLDHFINTALEYIDKASRARQNKSFYLNEAYKLKEQAHQFKARFNLAREIPEIPVTQADIHAAHIEIQEREKRLQLKREKRAAQALPEYMLAVTAWREGSTKKPTHKHVPNRDHARLSQCGNYIETTRSAKAPVSDVRRMFLALKNGHDIVGMRLGDFTVRELSDDRLRVGCHTFLMNEVNYIMEVLNA